MWIKFYDGTMDWVVLPIYLPTLDPVSSKVSLSVTFVLNWLCLSRYFESCKIYLDPLSHIGALSVERNQRVEEG